MDLNRDRCGWTTRTAENKGTVTMVYVAHDAGDCNPENGSFARQSAALHVKLLTGSPDTECCFRLLYDDKKNNPNVPGRNLAGRLADLWPVIEDYQGQGYGAFVIVNEGGHSDAEITRVRALFVDGDNIPMPKDWHVRPSFVVRRDDL